MVAVVLEQVVADMVDWVQGEWGRVSASALRGIAGRSAGVEAGNFELDEKEGVVVEEVEVVVKPVQRLMIEPQDRRDP